MRCSAFLAASLDGYVAGEGDDLAWLKAVERPGEDYGYGAFFDTVDAVVLGRRTYDTVRGFEPWPYAGKRCVVLTHRAPEPVHDEVFLSGPPAEVVATLAAEGVAHAYVDGGVVVRQFLAAGLLDELTLSVIPVVLGGGVPLFAPGAPTRWLQLERAQAFESGLVQLRYRTA